MSYAPQNTTVWAEIPVSDLDRAMAFYTAVTEIELKKETDMGPDHMAIFQPADMRAGVAGHLYIGKPSRDGSGPTVHLAARGKLESTVERVKTAGGTVLTDIITIPAGRFVYCQDLDGNSVSFFETESGMAA